jgi:hypothetical protein
MVSGGLVDGLALCRRRDNNNPVVTISIALSPSNPAPSSTSCRRIVSTSPAAIPHRRLRLCRADPIAARAPRACVRESLSGRTVGEGAVRCAGGDGRRGEQRRVFAASHHSSSPAIQPPHGLRWVATFRLEICHFKRSRCWLPRQCWDKRVVLLTQTTPRRPNTVGGLEHWRAKPQNTLLGQSSGT